MSDNHRNRNMKSPKLLFLCYQENCESDYFMHCIIKGQSFLSQISHLSAQIGYYGWCDQRKRHIGWTRVGFWDRLAWMSNVFHETRTEKRIPREIELFFWHEKSGHAMLLGYCFSFLLITCIIIGSDTLKLEEFHYNSLATRDKGFSWRLLMNKPNVSYGKNSIKTTQVKNWFSSSYYICASWSELTSFSLTGGF